MLQLLFITPILTHQKLTLVSSKSHYSQDFAFKSLG